MKELEILLSGNKLKVFNVVIDRIGGVRVFSDVDGCESVDWCELKDLHLNSPASLCFSNDHGGNVLVVAKTISFYDDKIRVVDINDSELVATVTEDREILLWGVRYDTLSLNPPLMLDYLVYN